MQSAQTSHAKFTDTQVNIGMSEDVITKEEFEFHSTGRLQKRLKLLRRLSIVAIVLSLYQLTYGGLSLYYFQSTFSSFSAFMGVASLLLSIIVAIWSNKALRIESNGNMFARNIIDGSWENFNSTLFLVLVFRAASSLIFIPNILMQADSVSQHVAAQEPISNDSSYATTSRVLSNMALILPFVEFIFSLILAQAARTFFGYIKDPARTTSRLIQLSNLVLLSSSLGLIYSVLRAQDFTSHYALPLEFSNWSSKGLMALGATLALISPIIWLMNYKRWRIPSFAVSAMTIGLIITLATFTAYTYSQRENVNNFYKDSTSLSAWSHKMAGIHRDDIEASGCPSKYLPQGQCERPLDVHVWEAGKDISTKKCLNLECAEFLGGFHSQPFLEITNFGLISIVSGLTVLIGGLYFWRFNSRSLGQSNKKDFKWLAMMGAIILVFFIAMSHGAAFDRKSASGSLIPDSHDQWFGGSGIIMNSVLAQKLTNLVVLNDRRYVIMRLNKDTHEVSFVKEGDNSQTYQDFLESLDPENAEIALLRLPKSHNQESLIGVVWIPSSTPEDLKTAYLQNFAVDKANPRSEKLGFPVHTAFDKQQLRGFIAKDQTFLFEESILVSDSTSSLSALAHNVKLAPKLAPGDAIEIYKMVMMQQYKYIVLNVDLTQSKASIEEKGSWDQTYDDFVHHFSNGEAKVGLIYLEVEGQNKLVAVILEDDTMTKKRQDLFGNQGIPNLGHLEKAGILPYVAQDINDLKLEKVLAGITSEGLARQQASLAVTTPGVMSLWNLSPLRDDANNLAREKFSSYAAPFSQGNPSIAGLPTVPSSVEALRERIRTVLVGEAGFSLGSEIFKMITMNKYKYLIAQYSTVLEKPELISQGDRNATYNNFINDINPKQAQVSLIYLDTESSDNLALIIYAPESSYNNPATVYDLFGLPVDPYRLELIGLKVFVARNMKDLKLENVMSHIYGDHAKIMNLIGKSVTVDTDTKATATEMMLNGLGEAGALLETVVAKKHKYVILKWNPLSHRVVLTHTGEWDDDFGDFIEGFNKHDEQIGLIHLELETTKKLVLVTFAPKELNKTSSQILNDFNLPGNLDSFGVDVYSAHTKRDLSLKKMLTSVYTDEDAVTKLIDQYQLLNLLNDDEMCLCDACHCNSKNATDYHNNDDFYSDDLDDEYIELDNLETDVFTTGANINLFGKMGLRLKRDIIKPLKSKQLKYIILKRDVPNKKVYIAKSGTWFATFDQFAREFEANQPQVGFIYLEVEGLDKLAMVVYAPSALNMDYMQVLKDFDVTKNPVKLRKKGISTSVVTELNDLTLDNTMKSVFGPEATSKMILTQLVEDYAGSFEENLMFALSDEALIEAQQMSSLSMFNSLGLKLKRDKRKLITNHKNKYLVFRKSSDGKKLEMKSIGTWHATLDQFAREFDQVDKQVGFIYLELEGKEKLVTVLFSPFSYNSTFTTIFKDFKIASSVKKLQKKGVAVYVAREQEDLQIEKVLSSVFNANDDEHGAAPLPAIPSTPDVSKLPIETDIADAINNKKYKYVILQHNKKKNTNEIAKTGDVGASYDDLVKQIKKREDQLIFVQLNLESKQKPVLIVYSRKTPTNQVLSNFGFSENVTDIEDIGLSVYSARDKKDLDIYKVLQGIYTNNTKPTLLIEGQSSIDDCCMMAYDARPVLVNDSDDDEDYSDDGLIWESISTPHVISSDIDVNALTMLYTEKELPFGKDVLDGINNKKFKYIILKHDVSTDKVYVEKFGKWGNTFKDFQKGFSGKDSQLGLIHITVEARDLLVLVIYSPKLTATVTLRQFGLPSGLTDLQNLGFRPYIARKKRDLDLAKVLQGVYNQDLFVQNNQAIFAADDGVSVFAETAPASSGSSTSTGANLYLDALKMMATKKYRYLIVQQDAQSDSINVGIKGDWSKTYDDFLREFDDSRDQVGLIYAGVAGNERLVLVIYAPNKLGHAVPEVAKRFKLSKNPSKIQSLGVTPYIAHNLDDLKESRVLNRAYTEAMMLVDTGSLNVYNSENPLWEERDGFAVPNVVGHDNWLRLIDLQEELKRKVSDV